MARSSRCSPCRSEPPRRRAARRAGAPAALLALVAWLGLAASATAAPAAASGSVAGTVTVERATLHPDGPKHDRDVVLSLTPVPPAARAPTSAHAEMDQKGLVFLPHVLAVEKGTTVTFLNSDNEQHNVYFLFDQTGETLDIGTWGPGVSVDHRFEQPGEVIVLCKLHLEMAAYVVVLDNPWFTTCELDDDATSGRFTIDDVPPGQYTLTAWHKKLRQKGGAVRVTVAPGAETRVDLVITKPQYARGP